MAGVCVQPLSYFFGGLEEGVEVAVSLNECLERKSGYGLPTLPNHLSRVCTSLTSFQGAGGGCVGKLDDWMDAEDLKCKWQAVCSYLFTISEKNRLGDCPVDATPSLSPPILHLLRTV